MNYLVLIFGLLVNASTYSSAQVGNCDGRPAISGKRPHKADAHYAMRNNNDDSDVEDDQPVSLRKRDRRDSDSEEQSFTAVANGGFGAAVQSNLQPAVEQADVKRLTGLVEKWDWRENWQDNDDTCRADGAYE